LRGYRRVFVGVDVRDRRPVQAAEPAPTRPTGASAHVPGLDGVRGLAVAAVVAYHLGFGWAQGGYLGVDTFLGLSGYLITSGLLAEHARHGRIGLRAFWGRRLRRLVPALLVVLAAVVVWSAVAALPDEARSLRLDGLSALAFVSNWRFIITSQGYFGQSAAPSLLRHTWSLGVEAQLYLLWPPLVVLLLSRRSRTAVLGAAAALGVASSALAMALVRSAANTNRSYYGTDTRAGAFLFGAAAAAALAGAGAGRRGRRGEPADAAGAVLAPPAEGSSAVDASPANLAPPAARGWSAAAGLAGLVLTAVLWVTLTGTSRWLFRGGLLLAGLSTVAMIVDIVHRPTGQLARALSWRPLRLLGRVSYGVYLWHWPLLIVIDHQRTGLSGLVLLTVRLAAIAVATTASWVLIERPILQRRSNWLRPHWQPAIGLGLSGALAVALLVPVLTTSAASTSVSLPAGALPATAVVAAPVRAAMFGDSVAVTLATGTISAEGPFGVDLHNDGIVGCGVATGTLVRSIGHTSVIPGICYQWEQIWQTNVDRDRPAVSVILLGRWEELDRQVDGQWQHLGEPSFDAYVSGLLDQAIAIAGSDGATVMLCTAPYDQGIEEPDGGTYPENVPTRADEYNELVHAAIARHPGVVLFDLGQLVSPDGHYASTIDGVAVRSSDGVHFSPAGGGWVASRLLPAIVAAATLGHRTAGGAR